ncbi:hemerythrin family protein [Magnetospira thiophila]
MSFVDVKKIPSTGNALIDEGHRHLAEVINEAYACWLRNEPSPHLLSCINAISKAMEDHFSIEIAVIRTAGFSFWKTHMVAHAQLKTEIEARLEVLRQGTDVNDGVIELFETLDALIYEHEILDDAEFWALFRNTEERTGGPECLLWTEEVRLEIPELDRQHQALCQILKQIYQVAQAETLSQSGALSLIEQFRRQVRLHFSAEQEYLRKVFGPDAESHARTHEDLLQDLESRLQSEREQLSEDLPKFVESYLAPWLMDHVRKEDLSDIKR